MIPPGGTSCPSHYRLLSVSRDASSSEIRKAYHRESLLYHPDKQRGLTVGSYKWWLKRWVLMRRSIAAGGLVSSVSYFHR